MNGRLHEAGLKIAKNIFSPVLPPVPFHVSSGPAPRSEPPAETDHVRHKEETMDFSIQTQHPGRKFGGMAFVMVFHAALVWALVNGLGKALIEIIPRDAQVTLLPPAVQKEPEMPPPEPDFKPDRKAFIDAPQVPIDIQVENAIRDFTVQPPDIGATDIEVALVQPMVSEPLRVPPVVDARACEKPAYPASDLREGIEGITELQFLIGSNGRVMEAKVVNSSGSRTLDRAALAGLSRCSFKAGTVDGRPEPSWTKIKYAWKID
jgi:protein TonB